MTQREIEEKLKAKFPPSAIEWRIQSCGKTGQGKIWAKALAYIDNRAIQDRLDEVVGPFNWEIHYNELSDGAFLCGIRIFLETENRWVEKWDGASKTDIEPTKGGISSSSKRTGSAWGIGRYLYEFPVVFVHCSTDDREFDNWAQLKDKTPFSWKTPDIPKQFLP